MRIRDVSGAVTAVAIAAAVAGCSGAGETLSQFKFAKTADLFTIQAPDSSVLPAEDAGLSRRGPVPAEQLVDAAGRCVADVPTGTDGQAGVEATASPIAGGAPVAGATPAAAVPADPSLPPLIGGVGLGMSECEVVRRAGQPTNVTVSADANNDRLAVLTYLGGNFPGIYRFSSGRLKVIERAPEPPKPERPVRRNRKKTATR